MHDKLMKKLEKKGKKLNPTEKEAKMGVLKDLSSQAGSMLKDKLKGLKKVTVASDSPEGLKAGLEKAEELVDKAPEDKMSADSGQSEEDEFEHESSEIMADAEQMSPDEIEEQIKRLQELKAKKQAQA